MLLVYDLHSHSHVDRFSMVCFRFRQTDDPARAFYLLSVLQRLPITLWKGQGERKGTQREQQTFWEENTRFKELVEALANHPQGWFAGAYGQHDWLSPAWLCELDVNVNGMDCIAKREKTVVPLDVYQAGVFLCSLLSHLKNLTVSGHAFGLDYSLFHCSFFALVDNCIIFFLSSQHTFSICHVSLSFSCSSRCSSASTSSKAAAKCERRSGDSCSREASALIIRMPTRSRNGCLPSHGTNCAVFLIWRRKDHQTLSFMSICISSFLHTGNVEIVNGVISGRAQ